MKGAPSNYSGEHRDEGYVYKRGREKLKRGISNVSRQLKLRNGVPREEMEDVKVVKCRIRMELQIVGKQLNRKLEEGAFSQEVAIHRVSLIGHFLLCPPLPVPRYYGSFEAGTQAMNMVRVCIQKYIP